MTKDLRSITVGELKEMLAELDDAMEIDVWDNLGLVTQLDLDVYDWGDKKSIELTIDGVYPY